MKKVLIIIFCSVATLYFIAFITSDFVASLIPAWHTTIYSGTTYLIILCFVVFAILFFYLIFKSVNKIIKTRK